MSRILDSNYNKVGEIDGNRILDANYNKVGEIDGTRILDSSYNKVGEIDGTRILDASYNKVGEIDGNRILDAYYNRVGEIDETANSAGGAAALLLILRSSSSQGDFSSNIEYSSPHSSNYSGGYNFSTPKSQFKVVGIIFDFFGMLFGLAVLLMCYSVGGGPFFSTGIGGSFSLSNLGHFYPEATVWYIIWTIIGYLIFAVSFNDFAERLSTRVNKNSKLILTVAKVIMAPVMAGYFIIMFWWVWPILGVLIVILVWGFGGHFTNNGY